LLSGSPGDVGIGAVLVDPEPAAPAKVPQGALDGALEHGTDLARLHVPEPLPAELAALLIPGAIENDRVQVGIEPHVGRRPLHRSDSAGLRAEVALPGRARGVERVHRLYEDAREPAEERAVLCEPSPPRERKGQHPLAQAGLRQHPLDQVGGGRAHPSSHARRAEAPALATERHQPALIVPAIWRGTAWAKRGAR
jgi:hypothetical protein